MWNKFKSDRRIKVPGIDELETFANFLLAAEYSSVKQYLTHAIKADYEAFGDVPLFEKRYSALRGRVTRKLNETGADPKKAYPCTALAVSSLNTKILRDVARLLLAYGLRGKTMRSIEREDVKVLSNGKRVEAVMISVKKVDKVCFWRDHYFWNPSKGDFKLESSPEEIAGAFPLGKHMNQINKSLKLTEHAYRRGAAIQYRKWLEKKEQVPWQVSTSKSGPVKYGKKVIRRLLGWAEQSEQLAEYSKDYEIW